MARLRDRLLLALVLILVLFSGVTILELVRATGSTPVSHTFTFWGSTYNVISHPQLSGINSAAELEAAIRAQNPDQPNIKLMAATYFPQAGPDQFSMTCYPSTSTLFGEFHDPNSPLFDPNAAGAMGPCDSTTDTLTWGSEEAIIISIAGTTCPAPYMPPDCWPVTRPECGVGGCVEFTWAGTDLPFASYVVTGWEDGFTIDQALSIPFIHTPTSAESLRQGLAPTVSTVYKWLPSQPPTFMFWTGAFGNGTPANFPVSTGDALFLRSLLSGIGVLGELRGATVSGTVYNDLDGNGVYGGADLGVARRRVQLIHQSSAMNLATAWTDALGEYSFTDMVPEGLTYEIQIEVNSEETWTPPTGVLIVSPIDETDILTGNDFGRNTVVDLALDLYQTLPSPLLFPCSTAVPPGNRIDYCIRFQNVGGTVQSAEVVLDLPPSDQATYLNDRVGECSNMAPPGPPSVAGTQVTWSTAPMSPGGECTVCVTLQVEAPGGDTLIASARIDLDSSGTQDLIPETPNNDSQIDRDRCSLDPNDKLVIPTGCGTSGFMAPGETLSYKVRFENQGEVPAARVEITDVLDSSLDADTLNIIDSSHTLTEVKLLPGRRLVFTFDNILLPPSSSDPEGSQGFVLFEIDPVPGAVSALKIPNTASIVFDLNPPVVTNTVINTVTTHALPVTGEATAELCNSIDDDCDGTIDSFPTSCGVGACATVGMCLDSVDDCVPGLPQTEICDNVDNNCDGTIDSFPTVCGLGVCAAAGNCIGGVDTCTPGLPTTEVCDNLDNDCDGTADSFATACGVGECAAAGTCAGGIDSCTPGLPNLEICDGLDNDCDGITDSSTIELNDAVDNQCPGERGFGIVDEITGTAGFTDSGAPEIYTWPAQIDATLYEVARGRQGDLSRGCGSVTTSSATLIDPDEPGPDEVLYYLVRPVTPNLGSWGENWAAVERLFSCEQEWSCDDGVDNDSDGPIDCADPGCQGVAGCPEIVCDDGLDNDGNGLTDCQEAGCDGIGSCEFGLELTCDDGLDNDGDELIDCQDGECDGVGICEATIELSCADGLDNDGDGNIDCQDADCQAFPGCSEVVCDDEIDNDANGFTDCLDLACDGIDSCEFGLETTCDDGLDNDANGLADCQDLPCDGVGFCELGTEITCNDGFDNDGDGLADCLDDECDGAGICEFAVEVTCDDALDNDGDGDTDCDDTDCDGMLGCPETLTINFSGPGQHLISLPREIASPPVTSAQELLDALTAAGVGPVSVGRFDRATDSWTTWTGGSCSSCGGACFCIDPSVGVAYLVEVTSAGSLALTGVDSTSSVVLEGQGPASASGTNVISLPFSSPLSDAAALKADIGLFVQSVGRLDPATGTIQTWVGPFGSNFTITPGEGYFVTVVQTTIYTPAAGGGP